MQDHIEFIFPVILPTDFSGTNAWGSHHRIKSSHIPKEER